MISFENFIVADPIETDEHLRFRAYFNYLDALRMILKPPIQSPESILSGVAGSRGFQRIRRNSECDLTSVERLLRNAWATEFQLALSESNSSLLHVANHWATVQLYYCINLHIRAAFVAMGRAIAETHRATLGTIAAEICGRPYLLPYPWNVACAGEATVGRAIYRNLPGEPSREPPSILSSPGEGEIQAWYCMLLRTTRQRLLDKSTKEWKRREKRKRLPSGERLVLAKKLYPTTLFDFLYRLRIRSNYSDADSYLLSVNSDESARFNENVRAICAYTSLVLEMVVFRYVGSKTYGEMADRFQAQIALQEGNSRVLDRLDLIRKASG